MLQPEANHINVDNICTELTCVLEQIKVTKQRIRTLTVSKKRKKEIAIDKQSNTQHET